MKILEKIKGHFVYNHNDIYLVILCALERITNLQG